MHQSTGDVSGPAVFVSDHHDELSRPSTKVIVYLEDNEDDCCLLRRALKSAGVPCRLEVTRTPVTARTFLSDAGNVPSLVICDLALGELSGFEFVQWVRQQPHLSKVPVMVVTGSLAPAASARARECGVNACVEKSIDSRELTNHIKRLIESPP